MMSGHDETAPVKCQTRRVALFNVNSHMMAVMMIQHSKVTDEVVLFNVNSHMMAVVMIQHNKVSDEVVTVIM